MFCTFGVNWLSMSTTLSVKQQAPYGNLFQEYSVPFGVYDEMYSGPDMLRPHWQTFIEAINRVGPQELSRRWEQAQQLIHENAVTYNTHGDRLTQLRPWELDALPLLVSADENRAISDALVQRARLLNLVLADLYGPQQLLNRGLLPPELVYAHSEFRRPYHGQRIPNDCYLHLYAADLVRSPEGQMWVVADRTEAPSGAGYALENRIIVSRMFPGTIHDCQVERLAPYFIALRDTLHSLAPRYHENPRIVLLTQGPNHPSYFEDAYLARYLGYTLVEGGDLAVRNNCVMLKTLGGLLPVEVILRRVDAANCDPLELRGDSRLGVTGLLQAVRSGNVVVANALGAGLVESPVFMAFLPRLCRELLGEDLKLPSVATWWCGHPDVREYVLENLNGLVILPAFRPATQEPVIGDQLSRDETDQLADKIRARPAQFVAQEQVIRSSAPVWMGDRLEPWYVALRTYLVASGDSYTCMAGGLTRVSSSPEPLHQSVSELERSKDAWVLSDGPVRKVSLLQRPGQAVELRRGGVDLPSRAADNLYWLGRHVERADGSARLLRTVLMRLTSESSSANIPELPVLLRGLADHGQIEPGFAVEGVKDPLPTIERALPVSVFDQTEALSLRRTLTKMHRLASNVRDRISMDSWRILNRIDQEFQPPQQHTDVDLSDMLAMLNQVVIDLAAFSGLVMESMTRSQGWRFLDIGRRIEQSLHVINLVRNTLVQVSENEGPVLEAVLEVADSLMTYRSRYLSSLRMAPVLDLLLTDETNPRSLAFQLVALCAHVEKLPRDHSQPLLGLEQRITMSALHSVQMADVEVLCEMQKDGARQNLDRMLSRLAAQLPTLSDAICHKYLIHAGPPKQLSNIHSGSRQRTL